MLLPVCSRKTLVSIVAALALSLLTACSAPWPWRRNAGGTAAQNAANAAAGLKQPDPRGLAGDTGPAGLVIEEGEAVSPPPSGMANLPAGGTNLPNAMANGYPGGNPPGNPGANPGANAGG